MTEKASEDITIEWLQAIQNHRVCVENVISHARLATADGAEGIVQIALAKPELIVDLLNGMADVMLTQHQTYVSLVEGHLRFVDSVEKRTQK